MTTLAENRKGRRRLAALGLDPLVVPELDGFAMVNVGRSKGRELEAAGVLELVIIGDRRNLTMASLKRLVATGHEAPNRRGWKVRKREQSADQPTEV